jgi:hypothetical protein
MKHRANITGLVERINQLIIIIETRIMSETKYFFILKIRSYIHGLRRR